MYKISIIVPIYHTQLQYLNRCLNSLLNQSMTDLEILLVFDGDNIEQEELCKKKTKINNNVRFLKQVQSGVSKARNYGVELATGEYIMFCDSDDWFATDICEKAYNAIIKNNADMLIWDYQSFKNGKTVINRLYEEEFCREESEKEKFYFGNICKVLDSDLNQDVQMGIGGIWNRMYKRMLLNECCIRFPEDCKISEDILFNLYATYFSKRIAYLPYGGYFYRLSEVSTTSKYDQDAFKKNISYFKNLKMFFEKLSLENNKIYNFDHILNTVIVNNFVRVVEQLRFSSLKSVELQSEVNIIVKENMNYEPYQSAIKKCSLDYFTSKQKVIVLCLKLGFITLAYKIIDIKLKMRR